MGLPFTELGKSVLKRVPFIKYLLIMGDGSPAPRSQHPFSKTSVAAPLLFPLRESHPRQASMCPVCTPDTVSVMSLITSYHQIQRKHMRPYSTCPVNHLPPLTSHFSPTVSGFSSACLLSLPCVAGVLSAFVSSLPSSPWFPHPLCQQPRPFSVSRVNLPSP